MLLSCVVLDISVVLGTPRLLCGGLLPWGLPRGFRGLLRRWRDAPALWFRRGLRHRHWFCLLPLWRWFCCLRLLRGLLLLAASSAFWLLWGRVHVGEPSNVFRGRGRGCPPHTHPVASPPPPHPCPFGWGVTRGTCHCFPFVGYYCAFVVGPICFGEGDAVCVSQALSFQATAEVRLMNPQIMPCPCTAAVQQLSGPFLVHLNHPRALLTGWYPVFPSGERPITPSPPLLPLLVGLVVIVASL